MNKRTYEIPSNAVLIHSHVNEIECVKMYYLDGCQYEDAVKLATQINAEQNTVTQLYAEAQFARYGCLLTVAEANE